MFQGGVQGHKKRSESVSEWDKSRQTPVAPSTALSVWEGAALASAAMNYFSRHQLQPKLQPLLKTNPRCVASSTGTCSKNWPKEKQITLNCIIAPPTRSSGRARAQSSFVFSAIERPKLTYWSLIHKQYCVPVSDWLRKRAALQNAISGNALEFLCRLCDDRGSERKRLHIVFSPRAHLVSAAKWNYISFLQMTLSQPSLWADDERQK